MTSNTYRGKCYPKAFVFSRKKCGFLLFVTIFFPPFYFLMYTTVVVCSFKTYIMYMYICIATFSRAFGFTISHHPTCG